MEANIRSDFFPIITLAGAQVSADDIIATAKNEAVRIIAQATLKASAIEKAANQHRERVASAIHAAQREINKW